MKPATVNLLVAKSLSLLQLSRQDFFIGAIDFDPTITYIAIGDIEANILEKESHQDREQSSGGFYSHLSA